MDEDLVRYHLRVLERAGLVRTEETGGGRLVYPMHRDTVGVRSVLSADERKLLGLLRRPAVLRGVVALLQEEPLTAGQLAERTGVSPSTMSHHLKRMGDQGLIQVLVKGRERLVYLNSRDEVLRMLSAHPPPRDLVQGFIESWDGLGL